MKTILLFTCLLLLAAGSAMAQSTAKKAGQSTKYILFPDFDADYARLQKNTATAGEDGQRKSTRSPRELMFTNYKPQNNAARPAANTAARKTAGSKLSSDITSAELAKQQAELNKAVKITPPPSQESQAPKQ